MECLVAETGRPTASSHEGLYCAEAIEQGTVVCDFKGSAESSVQGDCSYARVQFRRLASQHPLSWAQVLEHLQGSEDLRGLLASVLAGEGAVIPFEHFFWECVPLSRNRLNSTTFEFVAIEAARMNEKEVDLRAFNDQFETARGSSECVLFMTPSRFPKCTCLAVPAFAPAEARAPAENV
jgi:hypothetical protein